MIDNDYAKKESLDEELKLHVKTILSENLKLQNLLTNMQAENYKLKLQVIFKKVFK